MLSTRIVTAVIALALVLLALFLLPPRGFALAVLLVLLAAAREWAVLSRFTPRRSLLFAVGLLVLAASLVLGPNVGFDRGWPPAIVLGVCGIATAFWVLIATPWVIRRWPPRSPAVLTLVGYVVLLGAFVALVELQARSPWLVLGAMAIVWIADTAAYFCGRALGRRKLAPQVSPGKTWEGVYGGLAAVAVYALALLALARAAGYAGRIDAASSVAWLALVLAVAALSIVGDLFESWQKRQAGVKDSGALLPGHGGVLDRIDALLAAMPAAALVVLLVLPRA
jgi:phosphatidate cytidylyltransferase